MDANMQLTINSFRQLVPDKIFTLTAVKFPDLSRFSRQVVILKLVKLNLMFAHSDIRETVTVRNVAKWEVKICDTVQF